MAEPARALDRIDTAPAFDAAAVAAIDAQLAALDTPQMLQHLLRSIVPGRVAVVSSFGAESAVLLHLIAGIDRDLPLVFVNTRRMAERAARHLGERLGGRDLQVSLPRVHRLRRAERARRGAGRPRRLSGVHLRHTRGGAPV